jgi:SAM-dependent methyltransferase
MSSTNPDQAPEQHLPGDSIEGSCQVCSRARLRVLPFGYVFKDRFLYGVRCNSCGLVFLHPMPSDDEINSLYTEEYFTECSESAGAHGPRAYMDLVEDSDEERSRSASRLDREILRHIGNRGRFLEIGCGPGFFLSAVRELGWAVSGLEISEFATRHAVDRLRLNVKLGSIESDSFPENTFDVVFMGDVLEHLPRPVESLEIVKSWLKPGGVLAVAIPSTLNLISGKIGMFVYGKMKRFKTLRIPPYHLYEYTPRTVSTVLRASGFMVLGLRQSAVPLRKMGLRGNSMENAGKVILQLAAHATSRLLNLWGDRLLVLASRPNP